LPHLYELGHPVFVTWRLHGSLPEHRPFPPGSLTSGQAFDAMDRMLDAARGGPRYLAEPALAGMVVEAIQYGDDPMRHYDLYAYAVMPNHVHVLLSPLVPFEKVTRRLKGFTARRANEFLGRTGTPFWQEESYDRLVRDAEEFCRIEGYILRNPVRAGLAGSPELYPFSSAAAGPAWRPAAGVAACPTT
jgi:putative DNA methylase